MDKRLMIELGSLATSYGDWWVPTVGCRELYETKDDAISATLASIDTLRARYDVCDVCNKPWNYTAEHNPCRKIIGEKQV